MLVGLFSYFLFIVHLEFDFPHSFILFFCAIYTFNMRNLCLIWTWCTFVINLISFKRLFIALSGIIKSCLYHFIAGFWIVTTDNTPSCNTMHYKIYVLRYYDKKCRRKVIFRSKWFGFKLYHHCHFCSDGFYIKKNIFWEIISVNEWKKDEKLNDNGL